MKEILIKGYEPSSYNEWAGKITAIIFTGGCNFRCHFCHNKDMVIGWKDIPDIKFSEVMEQLNKRKKWIDAVQITGGEPSLHKADVIEMLNQLKSEGFLTKVDTNGFDPDFITELNELQLVDYWAMDIKASLDMYKKATDVDVKPETIRKSIKLIMESGLEYEFRTTVVPGLHDKFQIFKLVQEIKGAKKYFIQNFVPQNTINPEYMKIQPFTDKQLEGMAIQARQFIDNVQIR
jgi:pyruvate formate lyase activating enzyme